MDWKVIIHAPSENSQGYDPLEQRGTIGVKGQVDDVFYGAWTVISHLLWDKINHQEIADVMIRHITENERPLERYKLHASITPYHLSLELHTDGYWEVLREFSA